MDNSSTAQVFRQMLKWQVIATLAIAMPAYLLGGTHGALSAVFGGSAAIIASFVASLVARRSDQKKEAGVILISLLKAEGVKLLVVAILLWLTFKLYGNHVVPLALIGGLAAAAILSGAAIFGLNEKSEK